MIGGRPRLGHETMIIDYVNIFVEYRLKARYTAMPLQKLISPEFIVASAKKRRHFENLSSSLHLCIVSAVEDHRL
jgi:hypothetical protein